MKSPSSMSRVRENARTALLVTLISALIWIWAEAENIQQASVTSRVEIVCWKPQLALTITDSAWNPVMQMQAEGTASALDALRRALADGVRLPLGTPELPVEPGDISLRLRDALQDSPEIRDTGAILLHVEPETVTLRVVRLASLEVPVRIETPGIELDGEAIAAPRTVQVRLPEDAARSLGNSWSAVARVTVDQIDAQNAETAQTIVAKVALPDGIGAGDLVRVEPANVQVLLKARKRIDSIKLPTIPVWISVPPTEGQSWDIELEDRFLTDVTVAGPRDLIEQIGKGQLRAIAFVVLSSDDLEAGVESKLAVFAPVPAALLETRNEGTSPDPRPESARGEQVEPLKFSAEKRRVGLKIKRRTESPQPPP